MTTRLVDAHCHLSSTKYEDLEGIIRRSLVSGVVAIVAAGTDLASSHRTLEISRRYPNVVFSALGLHPERSEESDDEVEGVIRLIREVADEIVAVGEVGLPYYSIRGSAGFHELMRLGKPRLRAFLDLARELDLAIVLHAPHQAAEEALEVVEEANVSRVLFHWHKAPQDVTKAIVEGGYYVSVTPEVCYESRDRSLVKSLPISSLLLETDGPWPYEREFEGMMTEPNFLRRIAQEVAELKGLTVEEVAEHTTENAVRLFRLPKYPRGPPQ